MKKLLLLITALFILASVEGQILRYSNYTAPVTDGNPEMITNGNFNDGGTAWGTPGNGVTISDGRVNYDDSDAGGILQLTSNMISAIEVSTNYILEFDVIISSGNANIWIGNTSLDIAYTPSYSDYPNGHISIEFETPSNIGIGGFAMYFNTNSTTSFSIDNISLKLK